VLLGSSPGRSFLALEIAYLPGLIRGRRGNVRLAALESEEISVVGLGGLGAESVISGNLGFT